VIMGLFSVSGVALDSPKGKYEGYVFEPHFGSVISENNWILYQQGYQPHLIELQAPRNLLNLTVGEDNILLLQVKVTSVGLFVDKNDELYRTTGRRELPEWDGVIAYNDKFNKLLLKDASLLPIGRGGYDYYGCIDEQPLFKANIMGGDQEELFVITGAGHHTDNIQGAGVGDHLKLHVYGGTQYDKLFEVMLMAVNYKPYKQDAPAKDYYFSKSDLSSENVAIKGESGEGRKLYSKLFIQDFNKNDRLDVLIWQREYKSRPIKSDNKPGFDLARNEFIWYEENSQGTGFDLQAVTAQQAEAWLTENNLTWKKGWPDKSFCTGTEERKNLPMTVMDDPVLSR